MKASFVTLSIVTSGLNFKPLKRSSNEVKEKSNEKRPNLWKNDSGILCQAKVTLNALSVEQF